MKIKNKNKSKYEIKEEIKDEIKNPERTINTSYKYIDNTLETYSYKNNIKRFNDYEKITNYFESIKLGANECLNLYKEEGKYLITKNILLYKQIGSKSVYGVVYKCGNRNKKYGKIPIFTAKIQLKSQELIKELKILKELSKICINRKIPCLPIVYKDITCNQIRKGDKRYPEIISLNKNVKSYSVIFNELASGDLKKFLTIKFPLKMNIKIWKNIYEQLFISLATLHELGIIHNDAHWGNFLYHKIKPGGCFHYEINGINYYIENIGYLWTSWDYGLITKVYRHGDYIKDIMRINLIITKRDYNLEQNEAYKKHNYYKNFISGYLPEYVKTTEDVLLLQNKIFKHIVGKNFETHTDLDIIANRKMTEDLWFKYLLDNDILYSKVPIGNILSSTKLNFEKLTDSLLIKKEMALNHLLKNKLFK